MCVCVCYLLISETKTPQITVSTTKETAPDVQQKISADFQKTSSFMRYGYVKPLPATPSLIFFSSFLLIFKLFNLC